MACGAIFTVGRDYSSDLVLEDKAVSRNHAIIRQLGSGDYFILDGGSANGSYVNGNRISVPTLLNNGDVLKFGKFQATFVSGGKPRRPYSLRDQFDEGAITLQETTTIPVTVLVAEFRDYSQFSKLLSIQQVIELMNDWVQGVEDCVQGFRGTLDRFAANSVYARWHHDIGTDHSVVRALHAACEIHQMTGSLREKYPRLAHVVRAGVSINNAQAIIHPGEGNTVISDINNLALINEYNTNVFQKDIVISKSAYENLPPHFWNGREQSVQMEGKNKMLYLVGYGFDEIATML